MGKVELTRQVVRPFWQAVPRKVRKVDVEKKQRLVEFPVVLKEERPVDVPMTKSVSATQQVTCPIFEHRDKPVPKYTTQVVPRMLVQERIVEIPHVQEVELRKEVSKPTIIEVV